MSAVTKHVWLENLLRTEKDVGEWDDDHVWLCEPTEVLLVGLLLQRAFDRTCKYSFQAEAVAMDLLRLSPSFVRSLRYPVDYLGWVPGGSVTVDPAFSQRILSGMKLSVCSMYLQRSLPTQQNISDRCVSLLRRKKESNALLLDRLRLEAPVEDEPATDAAGTSRQEADPTSSSSPQSRDETVEASWHLICHLACGALPTLPFMRALLTDQGKGAKASYNRFAHWTEAALVGAVLGGQKDCFCVTLQLYGSYIRVMAKTGVGVMKELRPVSWSVLKGTAHHPTVFFLHRLLTVPDLPPFARLDAEGAAHVACLLGYIDVVKYFLFVLKFEFHRTDIRGRTALHLSSEQGHLHVVKLLIKHTKVDPNLQDVEGDTAVGLACFKGQLPVIQYLHRKGRVNFHLGPNRRGFSLVHLASESGSLDVMRYLVEVIGLDPTEPSRTSFGITPLYIARRTGATALVDYLERRCEPSLESPGSEGHNASSGIPLYVDSSSDDDAGVAESVDRRERSDQTSSRGWGRFCLCM
jgi:ankyrin repeat protein